MKLYRQKSVSAIIALTFKSVLTLFRYFVTKIALNEVKNILPCLLVFVIKMCSAFRLPSNIQGHFTNGYHRNHGDLHFQG